MMVGIRSVAIGVRLHPLWRRVGLEAFILLSHIAQKVFAKLFRPLDFLRIWPRDMKIHRFIGFCTSAMFHEAAPTAFDLDSATSLLLDVLDICAAMANHLSSKIKARDRLHIDRYTLFGPFALQV